MPNRIGGLGIRDTGVANVVLLGKHAWNLFNATNKMWVKVYGHKYLCNNNLFTATVSPDSSSMWRSLVKAFTQL